ncbi:hypothetical protein B0H14DRAFT_3483061 [Mycena olivaceomarginata]|nr:hypothetical protein B0H14DRAFT_3483061 [Mycena olivaceomarginata]
MPSQTPKTTKLEQGERLVDLNALAASSSKLQWYPEPPRCTSNDQYFHCNSNTWHGEDVESWPEPLLAQKGPDLEERSCGPVETDAAQSEDPEINLDSSHMYLPSPSSYTFMYRIPYPVVIKS